MQPIKAAGFSLALLAAQPAGAETIELQRSGARPSAIGSSQFFTGHVVVDPMFPATPGIPATGGLVIFSPGARSAWHTHPAGQTLVVTQGTGWIQEWNGERRTIQAGDVVTIAPGVKHWHGASARNGMSHIAISGMRDGKNVEWLEQVSDEQYGK